MERKTRFSQFLFDIRTKSINSSSLSKYLNIGRYQRFHSLYSKLKRRFIGFRDGNRSIMQNVNLKLYLSIDFDETWRGSFISMRSRTSSITSPVSKSEAEIWTPSSNQNAGICDALATLFINGF